jgi:hypothetical protein
MIKARSYIKPEQETNRPFDVVNLAIAAVCSAAATATAGGGSKDNKQRIDCS